MLSNQHSFKKDNLEAAQATNKVSIATRIYRWFHPEKYDESLFGDDCDEQAFSKLELTSSTWIKKVVIISNNIFAITIGLALLIAAIVTNEREKQYFFSLIFVCIYCSLLVHNIFMLMVLKLEFEPLEVLGSVESLFRINTVWSERLWLIVTWPMSTSALAIGYHLVIGTPSTV
ncbi:hypothetical protein METSCH_D05080 [Metschnikowia aff. pulcherrima]|uniref:Uncharacterized protein n=1 Tax=Metschnikowia aff. pulcherrima TaxID=2163413 RepID=A0A4P6XSS5_9ASCO|nr:hypothetical protein METSCH_D05080 [Metschnikowia aff. pulcherrima]